MVAGLFAACDKLQQEGVSVMTFNIRYDNPGDGIFGWENRRDLLFWVIKKYDPDILAMQEALSGQVADLAAELSAYDWAGVGRDDGLSGGEHVPVFFRKDRFRLASEGHFWLSQTPALPGSKGWDAACPRMLSWVRLEETGTGYHYYVFNTHLDHVGEQARRESARLITDSIRAIAGLSPVVLTGDLNDQRGSESLEIITQLLADAGRVAEKSDTLSGTTFVGFPANIIGGSVIDHIFVSRHFSVEEYNITGDNNAGYYPSDHLPVMVRLKLKMP
jgi:endonuclease/exonuclease/phosphatase family metal-dependent hydrolase